MFNNFENKIDLKLGQKTVDMGPENHMFVFFYEILISVNMIAFLTSIFAL